MHSPVHTAAYVLHPRYQDVKHHLDIPVWCDFLQVAERLLGPEKGANAVNQFHNYRSKMGLYGTEMAQSQKCSVEPCNWWANYGCGDRELQELAMKILSQPASASSSEQNWSQYDFVHNKRRNRLKSAVASQLVVVYTSLRLLEKQTDYRQHLNVQSRFATPKPIVIEDRHDGNASDTDREERELDTSDDEIE